MDHSLVKQRTTPELGWREVRFGRDAVAQERNLDPTILRLMPSEIDTYIDVNLTTLLMRRIRKRLSKLFQSTYSK